MSYYKIQYIDTDVQYYFIVGGRGQGRRYAIMYYLSVKNAVKELREMADKLIELSKPNGYIMGSNLEAFCDNYIDCKKYEFKQKLNSLYGPGLFRAEEGEDMESDTLARLMLEKAELEKRLDKLVAFIEGSENFQNLGTIDKALLLNQKDAMVWYLEVLTTRLDRASTRKS